MKKFCLSLYVLLTIILVTSCAEKTIVMDINQVSKELFDHVKFQDELTLLNKNMIKRIYEVSDDVKCVLYVGTGATAEEIAIFEAKDTNGANDVLKIAKGHLESQKKSFESYIPKEVPKLEKAVLTQKDKYVVVCVTEDTENAQKIIDKYFK